MPTNLILLENIFSITNIAGLVMMVGAAIIVLFSRRKEIAAKTDRDNVTALEGLLKTRTQERDDEKRLKEESQKEVVIVTGEYTQIAQVDMKEVIRAWESWKTSACYAENRRLREQRAELCRRLAVHENVPDDFEK